MFRYELRYKYRFNYAMFSGVRGKKTEVFSARSDTAAVKKAHKFLAGKNQQGADGEYNFQLVNLVRIIE